MIPFISAPLLDSPYPFHCYGRVRPCKGRTHHCCIPAAKWEVWYRLRWHGRSAEVCEAMEELGNSWQKKWDALCSYSQDVGDDSNGPAVDGFAVWFLGEDLGGCRTAKPNENSKQ